MATSRRGTAHPFAGCYGWCCWGTLNITVTDYTDKIHQLTPDRASGHRRLGYAWSIISLVTGRVRVHFSSYWPRQGSPRRVPSFTPCFMPKKRRVPPATTPTQAQNTSNALRIIKTQSVFPYHVAHTCGYSEFRRKAVINLLQ